MKAIRRKSLPIVGFGVLIFALGILAGVFFSTSGKACRMTADLRRHLAFAKGVTTANVGGVVLVEGEAESLTEYHQISEIISAVSQVPETLEGLRVRNRVKVSEKAKTIVADLIERQIGSPEIVVRAMGDTVFFEGTAESDFEADRAVELARTSLRFNSGSREASSVGETVRDLWPAKIVDLMRVRARSEKARRH